MQGKLRKGYRTYCALAAVLTLAVSMAAPAFADGDPLTVINNLSDFIFGLIRAVGMILLGFGIVQVGLSLQSHDASQRSNGFLTLAGAYPPSGAHHWSADFGQCGHDDRR